MADMLTTSDVLALTKNNNDDNGFGGNGGVWVFLLFLLFAFGGYGGGFGGRGGMANMVNNDFLYTNLKNTMDNGFSQVANQQFATQKDIWQTGANLTRQVDQGFNSVASALCNGFNATQREIADNRFAAQQCC